MKKHEFGNAGWKDLVKEFEAAGKQDLQSWAKSWVVEPGAATIRIQRNERNGILSEYEFTQFAAKIGRNGWPIKFNLLARSRNGFEQTYSELFDSTTTAVSVGGPASLIAKTITGSGNVDLLFPNSQDYGYGIFLLDNKSRGYVLKNIQNEKDPFLRSMMWGALWDSVREGELDPLAYVQLAIKSLPTEYDESITSSVLVRVSTAVNYYLSDAGKVTVTHELEDMMTREINKGSSDLARRLTYYRSFLNIGVSIRSREVYKTLLKGTKPIPIGGGLVLGTNELPLRTKDKFDIVTRLLILNDPEGPVLLAELEKKETSDDAKRYAYAAKAGIGTAENKAKYWNDFVNNKEISESWIEAAFGPWNSIRHSNLTLQYLERALKELPNHKRDRKIFFVNGWLGAFIGGQRREEALAIVNKFLADNPALDNDLRLKILENSDLIERAVKIRTKFK